MKKKTHYLLWILIFWQFVGCGPETIFMRIGLDTPEQHVYNGHILLSQNKLNDATREFERAKELDPNFTEAYVGLSLVLGHQGDAENALEMLNQAKSTVTGEKDFASVEEGYEQLRKILKKNEIDPGQQ